MRNEVEALRDVVRQQAVVMKNIGTRIVKQEETLASPVVSSPSITKPRDVLILKLTYLEGLDSRGFSTPPNVYRISRASHTQ